MTWTTAQHPDQLSDMDVAHIQMWLDNAELPNEGWRVLKLAEPCAPWTAKTTWRSLGGSLLVLTTPDNTRYVVRCHSPGRLDVPTAPPIVVDTVGAAVVAVWAYHLGRTMPRE